MKKKSCRVQKRAQGLEINFEFLFQDNVPLFMAEKRTVKPENAFKDLALRVPLENFKFYIWL
jgi:hypothetical protein